MVFFEAHVCKVQAPCLIVELGHLKVSVNFPALQNYFLGFVFCLSVCLSAWWPLLTYTDGIRSPLKWNVQGI